MSPLVCSHNWHLWHLQPHTRVASLLRSCLGVLSQVGISKDLESYQHDRWLQEKLALTKQVKAAIDAEPVRRPCPPVLITAPFTPMLLPD